MEQQEKHEPQEVDLRGTAIMVTIVGVILVAALVGAIMLYTSRGFTFLG